MNITHDPPNNPDDYNEHVDIKFRSHIPNCPSYLNKPEMWMSASTYSAKVKEMLARELPDKEERDKQYKQWHRERQQEAERFYKTIRRKS